MNDTPPEYRAWLDEFWAADHARRIELNKEAVERFGPICQNPKCKEHRKWCTCKVKPEEQIDLFGEN